MRSVVCSNAKVDCGSLHNMFASLWGECKDLVDELVWKMNLDTAAPKKVEADIHALFQTQTTQLSSLQAALAEASTNTGLPLGPWPTPTCLTRRTWRPRCCLMRQ